MANRYFAMSYFVVYFIILINVYNSMNNIYGHNL